MATTTKHYIGEWDTFHNNGPFATKVLYKTYDAGDGDIPEWYDRYNDAAEEMKRLLQEVKGAGEGFRAYGTGWSMSHIAHQKDNMHFNAFMNMKRAIQADELHDDSSYKRDNLFFFQCGCVIKELTNFLFKHGKSLKATGASNGQTIAGCISTGVHGSALDVGSVQDWVVGINLITGPDADDIVYIERSSRPVLNDGFAKKIHARVIRDDAMFNAALVGLGSFGFIHGVVIEGEDRFLLKRYVRRIDKVTALELANTMDFANSSFKITGETDDNGVPNRPFHYKVFINPYVNDTEYVVEVMYKKPYTPQYDDPVPVMKTSIYRDLIVLFMKIAEKYKHSIPTLIKVLEKSVLPPVDLAATGTLGEIFWDAGYQGPAFACAVGIDHRDSGKALELLMQLAKQEGPIPGIYAMRFVKQSEATLAFTRFPITCMLEIDGLIWKPKNKKAISLEQFCKRTIEVLQQHNIPFTIHWGKNADWKFEQLAEHMYGDDKVAEWKEQRALLLGADGMQLFNNDFLEDLKLNKLE